MEQEAGDDYVRRIAAYIRANEHRLAHSGPTPRRPVSLPPPSLFSWLTHAAPPAPLTLATDTHHLFYLLIRLEALGIDVGSLDVHIHAPSRPMSYASVFADSKNPETLSLASLRSSLSVVSAFSSFGSVWWSAYQPPTIDAELKYIYSSFTKLPALALSPPGRNLITELVHDPPGHNAVPLDAFKNLQRLECDNIDPRTLLGWDRLAESLRSLKIKSSGLHDVSVIFIGAVLDDDARRNGSTSRKRQRIIPPLHTLAEDTTVDDPDPLPKQLSSLKWAFLKHLYLPDNALTFFPQEIIPYFPSLTYLDLSSNLLVSVPPGLAELYKLHSLNLSDNLIDSVLGIYQNLGQVLALNLSHNRLESLCGLERLLALERVDLRDNLIDESLEIGRLAVLPNIAQLWVQGNPFTEVEDAYRITCFNYFAKEGKAISLDGTPPGPYEKLSLEHAVSDPIPSTSPSAPVISVEHARDPSACSPPPPDETSSSPPRHPAGIGGPRRKKVKRIVELDANTSGQSSRSGSHSRMHSVDRRPETKTTESPRPADSQPPVTQNAPLSHRTSDPSLNAPPESNDTRQRPRHVRHQTDSFNSTSFMAASDAFRSSEGKYSSLSRSNRRNTMTSRSEARRNRISASVFESPGEVPASDDSGETYRRRIEGLKKDMGESWLKVYNQSHG
ncbi:unnamed protein product [Cyclocybe aegerita]|uniref:Leucine rich repeat domain-containing protein n=1 Tax=Cyclocybe aegerita TaxID=1973307 RepID=A0A8S0VRE6_CYCAE|nr:unnamed protein product [Cyclocybe aegerita]